MTAQLFSTRTRPTLGNLVHCAVSFIIMIKKICNHCGRIYTDRCNCRKEKRTYNRDSFYDSPAWRSLSRFIRMRDYEQDRLCLYLMKTGRPDGGIAQRLYDYCIDTAGTPRYRDRLLVHHIVPREDDRTLEYSVDNLITVGNTVHEYIHQLYAQHGQEVQDILRQAVGASLP